MTSAQLKESLQNAPLTIQLVSGRKLWVKHTDYALISPHGDSVAVSLEREGVIATVAMYNIESVTPDKRQKKPAA